MTVEKLQFRVTGLTTSVLMARNGPGATVTLSSGGSATTLPLTLEAPAGSTAGLNAVWTATADLPDGGLTPGASINVDFRFAVVGHGKYTFGYNAEDESGALHGSGLRLGFVERVGLRFVDRFRFVDRLRFRLVGRLWWWSVSGVRCPDSSGAARGSRGERLGHGHERDGRLTAGHARLQDDQLRGPQEDEEEEEGGQASPPYGEAARQQEAEGQEGPPHGARRVARPRRWLSPTSVGGAVVVVVVVVVGSVRVRGAGDDWTVTTRTTVRAGAGEIVPRAVRITKAALTTVSAAIAQVSLTILRSR